MEMLKVVLALLRVEAFWPQRESFLVFSTAKVCILRRCVVLEDISPISAPVRLLAVTSSYFPTAQCASQPRKIASVLKGVPKFDIETSHCGQQQMYHLALIYIGRGRRVKKVPPPVKRHQLDITIKENETF